jgi:predicted transcriptional regulator
MSTIVKEAVIEMIRQLPPDVTIVDIMAELYFRQKVEAGLKELDEGKGVPHEQAREKLQRWLS